MCTGTGAARKDEPGDGEPNECDVQICAGITRWIEGTEKC